MTLLQGFLVLTAISICFDSGLAQNNNLSTATQNPPKQSETVVEKSSKETRPNRPALIFIKAGRERIYALLTEQMNKQEFILIQKDAQTIVFSKRTPGAAAATIRKQFDRRVTTPIVDDPRTIIVFAVIEKDRGCVVGGRVIVTTILNGQVFSREVFKEARRGLNLILEKLKSDAEGPQVTP